MGTGFIETCANTNKLPQTAAIQSLKRKKLYEQQIEQLGNFQLRIHDQVYLHSNIEVFVYCTLCVNYINPFCMQMIMLEAAKATTETVDALRTGAAAMKAMQKATLVLILSPF